jgi:hypothetical protein
VVEVQAQPVVALPCIDKVVQVEQESPLIWLAQQRHMLAVVAALTEKGPALLVARALVVKVEVRALQHQDKQTLVVAAAAVVAT